MMPPAPLPRTADACASRSASLACACLLAAVLSGCSWIGVRGPASASGAAARDCTSSSALPAVDTGVAVLGGAGILTAAILAASVSGCRGEFCGFGANIGAVVSGIAGAVLAAFYAPSAYYGWKEVGACRRALGLVKEGLPPARVDPWVRSEEQPARRMVLEDKDAPAGFVISSDTDRTGGDYHGLAVPSVEACRRACAGDSRCKAFVVAPAGRFGVTPHCFLKEWVSNARRAPGFTSSVK